MYMIFDAEERYVMNNFPDSTLGNILKLKLEFYKFSRSLRKSFFKLKALQQ